MTSIRRKLLLTLIGAMSLVLLIGAISALLGVLYAMGYCGTGLPMSTWLGHKLALRVLGDKNGATGFDGRPFPTRPFYNGNPWFLPLVVQWYGHKDRRDLKRARKAA